jgi:trans-2,3-dihydro-3-hydroxyanthranilate isomerase
MRQIDYLIYDVFTNQPFTGNQLGVVLNAGELSGAEMQAIAREFNLSETIFFLPPDKVGNAARVRIFMPLGELPFAGHPTIGGAIAFAGSQALPNDALVVLEEGIGPIDCIATATRTSGRASFTVPRASVRNAFAFVEADIAAALGIDQSDIGFDEHEISMWSAGVPYVMVPVKSKSILEKLHLDAAAWLKFDVQREGKIAAAYIYCRESQVSDLTFRARMFAPWDGIPEDPATGSAVAAFSGAVWHFEGLTVGEHAIAVHQGIEMGRPSLIGLKVSGKDGRMANAVISGDAVMVAEGRLYLPN